MPHISSIAQMRCSFDQMRLTMLEPKAEIKLTVSHEWSQVSQKNDVCILFICAGILWWKPVPIA